MAQFYRDFTEYAVGASVGAGVDDLTPWRDATTDLTTTIVDDPLSPSGRSLFWNKSGFTGVQFLTFDEIGSVLALSGQVYVVGYTTTGDRAGWSRGGFSHVHNEGLNAHLGFFNSSGGGSTVRDYAAMTADGVTSSSNTGFWAFGVENANRLRCHLYEWETSGLVVTKRFKSWFLDEPEPGSFTVSRNDSIYSDTPGLIGFGKTGDSNTQNYFNFVGVGINGDLAPRTSVGPGPSTRRRSPLLLTPW